MGHRGLPLEQLTDGDALRVDPDPLRQSLVLDALPADQRDQLIAQGREVTVAAGEWLLREREEAGCMYVIRSGRLDVVKEGSPEAVIRRLRRGDVVGELALLHSGRRTASVRAVTDAVLLELGRAQFESLIRERPSFAVALTRAIGSQLAVSYAPVASPRAPRAIAVVLLDAAAPGLEAVQQLQDALGELGGCVRLEPRRGCSDAEMLDSIDRAMSDAERVLLLADDRPGMDAWSALCLREADTVLALTSGVPDRDWLAHAAALHGCQLLVSGPRVSDTVLAALRPSDVQVVTSRSRLGQALGSTARRLAGRAVGLVLSGGGARALAHLGVAEELLDAGIEIDRVGGVSLGGLIAGAFATGRWDIRELSRKIAEACLARNPTGDYAVPAYALLRGQRIRKLFDDELGELRIEELPRHFFCVSCDLIAREPVVHRTGVLRDAVYATLAIPGVLPPVVTADGRLLVDGGVLDNLPVETMARRAEGPVIASDVTNSLSRPYPQGTDGRSGVTGRLRRALTGSAQPLPGLGDTILRTVTVGSIDTAAAARRHADLVITPDVGAIGLLSWKQIDFALEIGRRAARAALDEHGELAWRSIAPPETPSEQPREVFS